MGSQVRATCGCGYEKMIMIGCGMATVGTLSLFPCLCPDCKEIVEGNLLEKPVSCPKCKASGLVPYGQKGTTKGKGKRVAESWEERNLTDRLYYCPKCDSYNLRFSNTGLCWD